MTTTQTTAQTEYEIMAAFEQVGPARSWNAGDTAANLYYKVRGGKLSAERALAKMPKSALSAPWEARIRKEFAA